MEGWARTGQSVIDASTALVADRQQGMQSRTTHGKPTVLDVALLACHEHRQAALLHVVL